MSGAPENVASRRTAERAGLTLVDVAPAVPEALALGLEAQLCRDVVERPWRATRAPRHVADVRLTAIM